MAWRIARRCPRCSSGYLFTDQQLAVGCCGPCQRGESRVVPFRKATADPVAECGGCGEWWRVSGDPGSAFCPGCGFKLEVGA